MSQPEPFESISLPRKDFGPLLQTRYRIYKDSENFMTVDAMTAAEAMKISGLEMAHRIEREGLVMKSVLKKEDEVAPKEEVKAKEPVVAAVPRPLNEPDKAPVEEIIVPPAAVEAVAINAPQAAPAEKAAETAVETVVPAQTDAALSNAEVDKLLNG